MGFVDVGGWDTHVNQGGANGYLAGRLAELGRGLAALADDTMNLSIANQKAFMCHAVLLMRESFVSQPLAGNAVNEAIKPL